MNIHLHEGCPRGSITSYGDRAVVHWGVPDGYVEPFSLMIPNDQLLALAEKLAAHEQASTPPEELNFSPRQALEVLTSLRDMIQAKQDEAEL